MSRAEKVEQAQVLREQGLLLREIAERMGVAERTVSEWLSDPDGAKLKARRDSYRGTCVDCGARTNGSSGRDAPERCNHCFSTLRHEERYWTPDRVVEAIRAYVERHGRVPGAAPETPVAQRNGVPHSVVVAREFGSWNAAIEAAGFEAVPRGRREPPSSYAVRVAEVVRLYGEGLSLAETGRRVGMSAQGVTYMLGSAGVPRRSARR